MGVWSKKLTSRSEARRGVMLFASDSISVSLTQCTGRSWQHWWRTDLVNNAVKLMKS